MKYYRENNFFYIERVSFPKDINFRENVNLKKISFYKYSI